MVEAAGIEPASENRITGTSTCLVDEFYLMDRTARRQTFQSTSPLNFASVRERLPRLSRQIDALSPVNGHIRVKRAAFIRQPWHTNNRLQLHYSPTFLRGQVGTTACNPGNTCPRRSQVAPTYICIILISADFRNLSSYSGHPPFFRCP